MAIAAKLLMARDLVGSKNFALKAHQHDPHLDGLDQITAVADVLLAAERRVNNHLDWYSILQLNPRSDDLPNSIERQYRKLSALLDPSNNSTVGSDGAYKHVADAWGVLSDPSKRALYDKELNIALDLNKSMPSSNSKPTPENSSANFWTSCPFCCNLYEYPREYENCRLRCQVCRRGFHAAAIPSLPPIVPGMDAYYCSWGFFPLGVWGPSSNVGTPPSWNEGKNVGSSSWKPFIPMSAGSFQLGGTGDCAAGHQEGGSSMNVPDLNGDSANAEGGNREKVETANNINEQVTPDKIPNAGVNEAPLLAVPISVRRPPKKKVAKKGKNPTVNEVNSINLGKGAAQESEMHEQSGGNVGGNVETGNGTQAPVIGAADPSVADGSQVRVEKVTDPIPSELHEENLEPGPVDIPSLLKLLGVKDEEMDQPFNDFGVWDK